MKTKIDPLTRYRVDSQTGCWIYLSNQKKGYPRLNTSTHNEEYAHRYFYKNLKGPIPRGMDLDHRCRNTFCVNVEHLDLVTRAENLRRRAWVGVNEIIRIKNLLKDDPNLPAIVIWEILNEERGITVDSSSFELLQLLRPEDLEFDVAH